MLEPFFRITIIIVFKRSAAVIRREQVFIGCHAIAVTYGLARAVEQISIRFADCRAIYIHLFILQVTAIIVFEYRSIPTNDIFTNKPVQPVVFVGYEQRI